MDTTRVVLKALVKVMPEDGKIQERICSVFEGDVSKNHIQHTTTYLIFDEFSIENCKIESYK